MWLAAGHAGEPARAFALNQRFQALAHERCSLGDAGDPFGLLDERIIQIDGGSAHAGLPMSCLNRASSDADSDVSVLVMWSCGSRPQSLECGWL